MQISHLHHIMSKTSEKVDTSKKYFILYNYSGLIIKNNNFSLLSFLKKVFFYNFMSYTYWINILYIFRFYFESSVGLSADTDFVFDLELPLDFIPQNADGEVEKFELLSVHECMERIFRSDYKTTSIPVTLDFLIRHGFISPDNGKSWSFSSVKC